MPQAISSRARAYSTAKRAGCGELGAGEPAGGLVRGLPAAAEHGPQVGLALAGIARRARTGREQDLPQVGAQVRPQDLRAAVDLGAEDGLGLVELAPHVHVVVAEAGEEEDHRPLAAPRDAGGAAPGVAQGGDRLRDVAADHRPAVRERPAADLQGEGDVRQVVARSSSAPPAGPPGGRPWRVQRCGVRAESGRSCQGRDGPAGSALGRLLQHDVDVGAAEAERADPGPARGVPPLPGRGPPPARRRAAEVDLRVRASRSGGWAGSAGAPARARS